jgi:Kef-type K+ transport system membrane component KefB
MERAAILYGILLLVFVGGFLLIKSAGAHLIPPVSEAAGPPAAAKGAPGALEILPRVLAALAAIIIVSRIVGYVFRRGGQSRVVGEMVAGILLGPSFFGAWFPGASAALFPAEIATYLGLLSQVGVLLFMFMVGIELDLPKLRSTAHSTLLISHASIVAPFLLGSALALLLYPKLAPANVPFDSFALFIGVAMSITAFPVLARILRDRGLSTTTLGMVAVACAAVDDATAWCLLAYLVSAVKSEGGSAWGVLIPAILYIAGMFLLVRPLLKRVTCSREGKDLSHGWLALVLAAVLLSSLATEAIGIHAIFGAFLFGTVIPANSSLAAGLRAKIEDLVVVLLLPVFFAFTGMRTRIGLVNGAEMWLLCALIIGVASLGKVGGSVAAARMSGLSWRFSACVGVLMNTRGLMELVVLNVGYDLGVVSPALFAMMVIMALATTFATTPLLNALLRKFPAAAEEAAAG